MNLPNPDTENKTIKEVLDQIGIFFEKDELKRLLKIHSFPYHSFVITYDHYIGKISLNDLISDYYLLTIRLENYTLELELGFRKNEYVTYQKVT
jgi:hypothetical protein